MPKNEVFLKFSAESSQYITATAALRKANKLIADSARKMSGDVAESGKQVEGSAKSMGEQVGFSSKEAADEFFTFKRRVENDGLAVRDDFDKTGNGAKVMGETIIAAAVAAGAALDVLKNEQADIEKRAQDFRDRNRTISQSLYASGQIGDVDRVNSAIEHQAKVVYANGMAIDQKQRAELFVGISNAAGTKATPDEKIAAEDRAAKNMAGGADAQTAINIESNALLLRSLGGVNSDAGAESISRQLTAIIGNQILSDRQTQILSQFDADHKGQGISLIAQLAQGGESARSATAIIGAAEKEITPEKHAELLVQAGQAWLQNKDKDVTSKFDPTSLANAIDATRAKNAADAAEDEKHIAEMRQRSLSRDAAADAAEAAHEATLPAGQRARAAAQRNAKLTERAAMEADAEREERERFADDRSKKPASFTDAQGRELELAENTNPGNRLQFMLQHPHLFEPELQAQAMHLASTTLPGVPSADRAVAAFGASKSGWVTIASNRAAALQAATADAAARESARVDQIHKDRVAIYERDWQLGQFNPVDDINVNIPWIGEVGLKSLAKYTPTSVERDASQRLHGGSTEFGVRATQDLVKAPTKLSNDETLKVLDWQMQNRLAPATQPSGPQSNAGIEGLLGQVLDAIKQHIGVTAAMPSAIASAAIMRNPALDSGKYGQT